MFNLSEEYKKKIQLQEAEELTIDAEINQTLVELDEAESNVQEAYAILESYYGSLLEVGPTPGEAPPGKVGGKEEEEKDRKPETTVFDILKDLSGKPGSGKDYEPVAMVTTTKLRDMKFPDNILFFIKQIAIWIRNVVIFVIEKFLNIIRRLVGAPKKEFDYNKLNLDLEDSRKFDQIITSTQSIEIGTKPGDMFRAFRIGQDEPKAISKTYRGSIVTEASISDFLGITRPGFQKQPVNSIVVRIDLAKDLGDLKELVQHFYNLFDNAYGSNNEKLFETDDLETVLNLLKDTLKRIKSGESSVYSVNGTFVEMNTVDERRVKDNLIRTNVNINNLKDAYLETSKKIKDILRIITNNELLMLNDLGVDYAGLSHATFSSLINIIKTILERVKYTMTLEKQLSKMYTEYKNIVSELERAQQSVNFMSNVTFDTVYNKKMRELLNCARMMSEVVSLRFAAIGLYLKELNEVKESTLMLANFNKGISSKKSSSDYSKQAKDYENLMKKLNK